MRFLFSIMFLLLSANYISAQITGKTFSELHTMRWNPKKNAPAIWDDNISADSIRVTNSSFRVTDCLNISDAVQIGVAGLPSNEGSKYRLCIYLEKDNGVSVKVGSPFLVKFGDDSRLDLTVSYSHEFTPEVRSTLGAVVTVYRGLFCVDVTNEFIDKLSSGIKKIRYERNGAASNIELKKDNISAFIKDCYELVKAKSSEKRNFDDGF